MAITRPISWLEAVLDAGRTFFHQNKTKMQNAFARYKVFCATRAELSSLSDRDLNDLGIPRSSIKQIAWEAAYGL